MIQNTSLTEIKSEITISSYQDTSTFCCHLGLVVLPLLLLQVHAVCWSCRLSVPCCDSTFSRVGLEPLLPEQAQKLIQKQSLLPLPSLLKRALTLLSH